MNVFSVLCEIPSELTPDHTVVEDDTGSLRYAELRSASTAAGARMRALGVTAGDVVVLMSTNRNAAVAAMLGAWRLGARVAWCNFRSSADELVRLFEGLRPRLLLLEERYRALGSDVGARQEGLVVGTLPSAWPATEDAGIAEVADLEDDDPALLIFTSGTTGQPKRVTLSHGSLTRMAELRGSMFAPGDPDPGANLIVAPFHHVAGISSVLSCLYTGRRASMLATFDPDAWIDAIERRRITHAFVVPTMLFRIVQSPKLAAARFSTLQIVTYGGARAPRSLVLEALRLFPPHVGFVNSYGLTETGATVFSLGPEEHRRALAGEERLLGSVGKPLPGVGLKILDEGRTEVPPGTSGDVWICSPYGASGTSPDGWMPTGDVGYVDAEGYLYLSGRRDELIIRGGENIAPKEVEEALRLHPAVLDCAVTGVPSEEWGQTIGALVVARMPVTAKELIDHSAKLLSRNKRPDTIRFVDEIPRSDVGKTKRTVLATYFEAATTNGGRGTAERA